MSKMSDQTTAEREANVVIELCMCKPMSLEVLDANSDDVLEAVQKYAADIALGATVSLRQRDRAILLRFDALAPTDGAAYRTVALVIEVIEEHTDLRLERHRADVEVDHTPQDERERVPA